MGLKSLFCPHNYYDQVFIRNLHGDEINRFNARSMWQCEKCGKLLYRNSLNNSGSISDGYHTFGELYQHRAILFSVICTVFKDKCWKSLKHSDGTMYDGMFIVGIDTPEGPATYHYDYYSYWNLFDVKELEIAPEWDGHTSDDAINRILSLNDIDYADIVKSYEVLTEKYDKLLMHYKRKSDMYDKVKSNILYRIGEFCKFKK